jgi:hypothetical protein
MGKGKSQGACGVREAGGLEIAPIRLNVVLLQGVGMRLRCKAYNVVRLSRFGSTIGHEEAEE